MYLSVTGLKCPWPGLLCTSLSLSARLFNDTPDAVSLFSYIPPGGATEEALLNNTRFMALVGKMVGALQTAVANMDNPAALATLTRDMGARHAGYGVKLKHLPVRLQASFFLSFFFCLSSTL